MAVLDPVKVIIDNYPEGQVAYLEVDNNVENPELGKRKVPFTREHYVCLLYTSLLFAGHGAAWLERHFKLAVIVASHTVRYEQ